LNINRVFFYLSRFVILSIYEPDSHFICLPNSFRPHIIGFLKVGAKKMIKRTQRRKKYKHFLFVAGLIEWHKTKFDVVASPFNINTIPVILS
jgi:hypothetical protein